MKKNLIYIFREHITWVISNNCSLTKTTKIVNCKPIIKLCTYYILFILYISS